MDIYTFVGILGLVIISIGVFWQKKYIEDLLYMIGGASLFLYSYHINEWIFIPFSALFVMSALAHLVRTILPKKVDKIVDKIDSKIEDNQSNLGK
ncbi:MAG: hypothetical protein HOE19_01070 [Candidatus Komeilibacteria bacterium]|jgi:hypothetical protein|nr:hypothetical protein [Candidatus Komeilibacteria bacterium]MBT4447136.1 hypothetical protein [Candidatus Komeilibacteria bacterium]